MYNDGRAHHTKHRPIKIEICIFHPEVRRVYIKIIYLEVLIFIKYDDIRSVSFSTVFLVLSSLGQNEKCIKFVFNLYASSSSYNICFNH